MANKIGGQGPRTWIGRLEQGRAKVEPAAPKQAGALAAPDAPRVKVEGDEGLLLAAGVPEKLAPKLAEALRGATAELAALAEEKAGMPDWRAKQFGRVLEQLYKVLAVQVGLLPPEARAEVGAKTMTAALALVRETGANDLLVPTLSAAIGLFDAGVRLQGKKVLAVSKEDAAVAFDDAARAVLGFAKSLDGKTGQGPAINVFGPLVEQLELGRAKLTRAERLAGFEQVRTFLEEVAPRSGFDMTMTAEIAEAVARGANAAVGDPARALATAKRALLGKSADALAQAKAGLLDEPVNLPAGAPRAAAAKVLRALDGVLSKSPAGPEALFLAVDVLRAQVPALAVDAAADPAKLGALEHTATIVGALAEAATAAEVIDYLAGALGGISARPAALEALGRAAKAKGPNAIAAALVDVGLAAVDRDPAGLAGLADAKERLGSLPPQTSLQVALVFARGAGAAADASVLDALALYAASSRPDAPMQAYSDLAQRYATVSALFPQYPALAGEAGLAIGIARVGRGGQVNAGELHALLGSLQQVKQYFRQVELKGLVNGEGAGHPGLAQLVSAGEKFANRPTDFLVNLLAAAAPSVQGNKELQASLARVAIELAFEAGHIHGGANLQLPRMSADWGTSVANPGTLQHAARGKSAVGLRAGQQDRSIAQFLKAHPELPLDFAFTAGQHLTPDQLAWAIDRVGKTRGRSTVRLLRDFTFGCIQAGRTDLIEAARTSKSPDKALSRVMSEVAQSYRNERAAEVPYDQLIAGLAAGTDPVAELEKQKAAAGLAALNLNELAAGAVDPKGVEEILKIQTNIADLLMQYSPNFKSTLDVNIDMGALRPVFLECLKSVVQGTWPKPKYENEIGKQIMAGLTPAQQAVWRQTMVTPENAAPVGAATPDQLESLQLLRGLGAAMKKEVRSLGPNVEWSKASLDALRQQKAALLTELHGVQKGTPEHRAASGKLGPVDMALSAIALDQELGRIFAAGPNVDATKTLLELVPHLEAAGSALRRLGARGSSEAVQHVLEVAKEIKTSPRQGRYAADEDGLTQLIDSHKSGCLSYGDQRRRWGMAPALADPHVRMLRAYDGDRQTYRAFLKFYQIDTAGYKGPALWVDGPVADGGGGGADLQVLYKHVAEKARAMGVPIFGSYVQNLPADFRQVNQQIKATIPDGNTHLMHSDAMFQGDIRLQRGANPVWENTQNWTIAFPPNVG